jgi:hypothetical protein
MPVQALNRLFPLSYRTDRLEVYPYATGWRSTVRTGRILLEVSYSKRR